MEQLREEVIVLMAGIVRGMRMRHLQPRIIIMDLEPAACNIKEYRYTGLEVDFVQLRKLIQFSELC